MYIFLKSYEERNLFYYKYLSRNETFKNNNQGVSFEDYCYKNCKIDSGTEYKNFNWTIFQTIRAITCFLRDPKYRGYCSAKRQLGINRVFTTREEEFFMWIIFFENNGRRMFATCAYPGFGNDYVSRGFLWIEDS